MSILRKDPIVKRWVIIAKNAPETLADFLEVAEPEPVKKDNCPFCPGNEDKTPPEIFAIRDENSEPNKEGWEVRVIPNKFPALQIEGAMSKRAMGIYDKMNGIGAHEVIIESPDHTKNFYSYDVEHVEKIVATFKERFNDLKKDKRLKYILIFKNHGKKAGASLEHAHCQLIATPVVVKRGMEEIEGSREYYEFRERCIYCDLIEQEISENVRLVYSNKTFIAITPFASRFPFEVWILPKAHNHDFGKITQEEIKGFADCLSKVLKALGGILKNPPYNFVIHTSPVNTEGLDCSHYYHWHLEIMPRLKSSSGFEWASGFYTNPLPPEEAAKYLREAILSLDNY